MPPTARSCLHRQNLTSSTTEQSSGHDSRSERNCCRRHEKVPHRIPCLGTANVGLQRFREQKCRRPQPNCYWTSAVSRWLCLVHIRGLAIHSLSGSKFPTCAKTDARASLKFLSSGAFGSKKGHGLLRRLVGRELLPALVVVRFLHRQSLRRTR